MELRYATVLIVEDEPMLLELFRTWLEQEHCVVLAAGDGVGALRILGKQNVDLIVSDIRMPVMDGLLLLLNLTTSRISSKRIDRPKKILISKYTDLEAREAYGLGVEALMQKPFKHDQFVNEVRRTLRTREEAWALPSSAGGRRLQLALPSVPAAIKQGSIAFGQGGFCVRCISSIKEGPVRFDLEFAGEPQSFTGHGVVRWADSVEHLLGVEISDFDEPCWEKSIYLITANATSSYIPRAPLSAARSEATPPSATQKLGSQRSVLNKSAGTRQ